MAISGHTFYVNDPDTLCFVWFKSKPYGYKESCIIH